MCERRLLVHFQQKWTFAVGGLPTFQQNKEGKLMDGTRAAPSYPLA